MKRRILFGLFSIILCLGMISVPNTGKVRAQPTAPAEVSALCGSDPTQVGCWQFNEGSGTTAADGSANGNNGTLVGNVSNNMWVADRFGNAGKALHFDGSTQYVQVPDANSLDVTGDITIAAWEKPEEIKTQDVVKKAVNGVTDGYELAFSSATGSCSVSGATSPCAFGRFNQVASADAYRIDSKTVYTASDPWTFYVVTYTAADTTIRLYRNGALSNSRVVAAHTITANNLYLGFGAELTAAGVPTVARIYHGSLDDVRIYSRALSAAEIETLYNNDTPAGFNCTPLTSQAGTANTEHKPMSKVWYYQGKWWSVFPASSGVSPAGAWLWRLDGTTWTAMLNLSTNTGAKADVKPAGSPVGSVVHILLYNGTSADLASVQYSAGTYVAWSSRPGLTSVALPGSETATIDIDSTGRMWLNTQHDVTSPNFRDILVYNSASPYTSWSGPLTIATGTVYGDDISLVTALPNNTVGVLWANETTHRFGFKYHKDTDPVATWSTEEQPTTQYGYDAGLTGFADDHLNVAVASDGTLYAAIKTGYDTAGFPRIALIVRRLSGSSGAGVWDTNIYGISETGTRPILLLDEAAGVLTVIYTSVEGGGNIVYNQSAIDPISFGVVQTMRSGTNNDVSSTKQNINGELVAIYSTTTNTINGSLCTYNTGGPVIAPTNLTASLAPGSQIDLTWADNSNNETGFAIEVAPGPACTSWSSLGTAGINIATFRHWNTTVNTQYCYRVRGTSISGNSYWSNTAMATTPVRYSALSLGRDGAYVRMTTADQSAIQLKQFTLEMWFRREGAGVYFSTGTSGILQGIPLVGKGSSISYGSVQDFNYILVIDDATDVIAADLEECDPATQGPACTAGGTAGLNHPILGTTPIVNNTWYHAAVTFDGTTLRLYLNGNLENALVVGRLPRWDNASPLGLGTAMLNNGTAQGFFDGSLDEVRIWNYARSQAEISSTMNQPISIPTTGLAARWSLNEASGTTVNGSAGTTINGSLYPTPSATGWNWTVDAPINAPPVCSNVTLTTNEDTTGQTDPSCTDADGDTLTYSIVAQPAHGSASVVAGKLSYTPAANYNGSDSFTYKANDGKVDSNTATVSVTITSVNDAPVITEGGSINVTMSEDCSPTPFALTLHATDPDVSDTLSWSVLFQASHGIASASGTGLSKAIGYTPTTHYTGVDSFVVQVSDGNGGTDMIIVNVTINPPPTITIFLPIVLR